MNEPTPVYESPWKRLLLVIKVVEVRLRFIAILVAVGLLIGYWDVIQNYWEKWMPLAAAARQLPPDEEFFCGMHPNVTRTTYQPNGDVPNCPICGMPLTIRKKGEKVELPPGITARTQLSPERIQLAGIQTAAVGYQPMTKEITTVGNVVFDESRLSRVTSRVAGYVEKLYIDKTFATVREGEPLAEIYSPDLYSTAQELLLAARSGVDSELVRSSRRRLELLGVSPREIDQILASGQAASRVVIRSPQAGYVIAKRIVAGSSVEMGATLLEVADLAAVWVEADVYEKDLPLLRVGQKVEAAVEAFPGRSFPGAVALVYPQLDTATRTARVRFSLDNPRLELRPGMFATVKIEAPLGGIEPFRSLAAAKSQVVLASGSPSGTGGVAGEILAVPERAVVDTGEKQVVYVEREPGLFEGVEVQLGPRSGGYYPVIKGLSPGDRVAAAGAFLVDAETRLNPAAASTYFGASGAPQGGSRGSASPAPNTRPQADPGPTASAKPIQKPKPTEAELKNVSQLSEQDRQLALVQGLCPITGKTLGAMGVPIKVDLQGQAVLLCCKGCLGQAKKNYREVLEQVTRLKETK